MRIKLILTTAAFGVASLAVFAHVYSVNSDDYLNVDAPARGDALMADPLNTGGNTVSEVLPGVLEGTIVYRYSQAGGIGANRFECGEWSNGEPQIRVDVGFFVQRHGAGTWTRNFSVNRQTTFGPDLIPKQLH